MQRFIDTAWEFGGQVLIDNITIYQLTKAGLALQCDAEGYKVLEG